LSGQYGLILNLIIILDSKDQKFVAKNLNKLRDVISRPIKY